MKEGKTPLSLVQFVVGIVVLLMTAAMTWGVTITRLSNVEAGQASMREDMKASQSSTQQALGELKASIDDLNKKVWEVRTRRDAAEGR